MTIATLKCVFLIGPAGRLLAVDAFGAEEFGSVETATDLFNYFPQLSKSEQTLLLDQNDKEVRSTITLFARIDGTHRPTRLTSLPMSGQSGDLLLLTIEAIEDDTNTTSHRDALTGLPDRQELADYYLRLQQSAASREIPIALLFMDLNDFKQINDVYGHTVGDQVLTTLASRWQDCVREGDLVVRYGGDEFVVLIRGVASHEEVRPVVARLQSAAAIPMEISKEKLTLGVTIGVAFAENSQHELKQLINRADREMYRQKGSI